MVFGQNAYGKALVVNELFNQTLLPVSASNLEKRWRMVRFIHAKTASTSLTLPGSFVLVGEELESNKKQWRILPEEDLCVNPTLPGRPQSSREQAVLEVDFNNTVSKLLLFTSKSIFYAKQILFELRVSCYILASIICYKLM